MLKKQFKWPESKFERDLKRIFKTESRRAIKWLFCYEPKGNMDLALHIVDVLALIYIGVRLIGGG